MKNKLRLFTLLLIPLAVIPIFAGWVGDVSKDWFGGKGLSAADPWLFGIGLVGVMILAFLIYSVGHRLLGIENIEESTDVPPHAVVIALLSPCLNLQPPAADEEAAAWRIADSRNQDTVVSLAKLALADVINPGFKQPDGNKLPQWTWQQTLRAACHHGDKLQRLVLIGSEGTGGSGTPEQLSLAKQFFSHYFPGKVHVLGEPKRDGDAYDTHSQADFEKLDDLRRLLKRVLKDLNKAGFPDSDIIIDCTGGQKIASIACALVTLDRPDLMFQYVGTHERNGKVIGFNAVTESRST